jgi:hypothetical protein
MALDTYDDLVQSIADHLDRDDLAGFIDDFIDIAESNHRDQLRFRDILVRDTSNLTLTQATNTVALPADFNALKHLRIPDTNTNTYNGSRYLPDLQQLTEDQITQVSRDVQGPPQSFCINDVIEFNRDADQNYEVHLLYYKVMTPLATGNQTNELLDRAPEIYLYGALIAAEPFLMNDERLVTWASLYDSAVARLVAVDGLNKYSGTPIARVASVVP